MAGQKGNKNRKYGRNAMKCKIYWAENRRMCNKIRKLKTYTRHNPADLQAARTLVRLQA